MLAWSRSRILGHVPSSHDFPLPWLIMPQLTFAWFVFYTILYLASFTEHDAVRVIHFVLHSNRCIHCQDCMNIPQFSSPDGDGHLGCWHFGNIMNGVAMNIPIRIPWTYVCIYVGHISRSAFAWPYSMCLFSFTTWYQRIFQNGSWKFQLLFILSKIYCLFYSSQSF